MSQQNTGREQSTRWRNRPPQAGDTPGMRAMFWSWTAIIALGLGVMIITPLTGR